MSENQPEPAELPPVPPAQTPPPPIELPPPGPGPARDPEPLRMRHHADRAMS